MYTVKAIFRDGSRIKWLSTPERDLAFLSDAPACYRVWSAKAPESFVGVEVIEEGPEGPSRVKVTEITIDPVETNEPKFTTVSEDPWSEADAELRRLQKFAPAGGAYSKTDFYIAFEDGETYSGRYDLKNKTHEPNPSLKSHVWDFVRFSSGIDCPEHMTEESWRGYLVATEKYSPGIREAFSKLYHEYDVVA